LAFVLASEWSADCMNVQSRGDIVLSLINNLQAFAILAAVIVSQQDASPSSTSKCRPVGTIARLPELPEASGVAASHRTPGVFWAHNDSGDPVIYALDSRGAVTGRVRVAGASVDDWEDIAVGRCPQGSCVYVADIGDNSGRRKHITLYRVAEPRPHDAATNPVEAFEVAYPDGSHDAEALFVAGGADVFLITKGDPGSVALYRFPQTLASGTTLQLQRIGEPIAGAGIAAEDRPTAADVSPDGQWVAVRTTKRVAFYRTADLIAGRWREVFRTDVSGLDEPRGEGVTFASDDTLVLVGEADGPLRGSGTFARLTCALSQVR
jgi:hypothetical protein